MDNKFAVVTGASRGLGRSFAFELAQRKRNLILISLPDQALRKTAAEISKTYQIEVKAFETDLSIKKNIISLSKALNEEFEIDILINNAGIGGTKRFEEVNVDYLDKIIQLNVLATTLLTHQLLPNLKRQQQAYILNVSSLAALSPMGYKTVYPASKAFIQSFSRGLNSELKKTNVSVSVVNPGGMKTNEETTIRLNKQGFLGKLTSRHPDYVARYSINRLLSRTEVIKVNFLSWCVLKIVPTRLAMRILSRKMQNEIK